MGKRENRVSRSYVTGVVAFVFLVIGYQTALFVHRAAVESIVANRDHPDTVFVVDRALAQSIVASSGGHGAAGGDGGSLTVRGKVPAAMTGEKNVIPEPGGYGFAVRKDSEHSPEADIIAGTYGEVREFMFDPNTATIGELMMLGFTQRQAEVIDSYRKKGGRFRRKEDFARSFVVHDSVYRRLEPFIDIPLLDLNLADSAALDALPGIGGYFASKILEYRDRLGGSYSYKEQLMDIYRFDREKFDALSDLVSVSPDNVIPYPMWTLPEDSLRRHPYIGSYAAHGIVVFRENNPPDRWTVEALSEAGVIRREDAVRLGKCVIAGPGQANPGVRTD